MRDFSRNIYDLSNPCWRHSSSISV